MKIWSQASSMAAQTPPERNRYVDFLRAVSILVVVVGHWLIATAYYVDGDLTPGHLLKTEPQTQWLTWLFQVMPIFFIVGGYANAVSLESAKRKGVDYSGWLAARLNRLVAPLLVLVIAWTGLAIVMHLLGARPEVIKFTSLSAFVPTWFLAIYIIIVILAPLAYQFWQQLGFGSFWVFVALAVLNDFLFFTQDVRWLGTLSYLFVWLAVHQLGFAWRDDKMGKTLILLVYSAIGLLALYLLIFKGPYPLAMVGSPDADLSNTRPPKITLIALGVFQFGLLLALEGPMRRALNGLKLWTATVLVNSMIMTVYLWHITVMIIFGAVLYLLGGFGLAIEPGTSEWWWTRPVWIGTLLVLLVPVALLLSPLERGTRGSGAPPSVIRQVLGALMLCFGIAMLAIYGYGGGPVPWFDAAAFGLVIVGAGISGLLFKGKSS